MVINQARYGGQSDTREVGGRDVTSENELTELIDRARVLGATVTVDYDGSSEARDPRGFISQVRVANLDGVGPYAMSPLSAAERLREVLSGPLGWTVVGTHHPDLPRVPNGWASVSS